jgi:hypothetical protein
MAPLAGPLFAAAALLALAGANKVTRPDATRVALRQANLPSQRWMAQALGAVEVAIGVAAIAIGGTIPAALTAISYAGFSWFSHRLDRATRGTADCGCFGAASAPVGRLHVAVNATIAVLAAAAAATDPGGIATATSETPWAGVPFLGLTALLTWMVFVTLTALPATLAAARPKAAA